MSRRVRLWLGSWALGVAGWVGTVAARADDPAAFALPEDRATWERQRIALRREAQAWLGDLPPSPSGLQVSHSGRETSNKYINERFDLTDGDRFRLPLALYVPKPAEGRPRVPAVLLGVTEREDEPIQALLRRGIAVLIVRTERGQDGDFRRAFRDDGLALSWLVNRPEIDPRRIGVAGSGEAARAAFWRLALDERVRCGVVAGGLWELPNDNGPAPEAAVARLTALCAPRPLSVLVSDQSPQFTRAGFELLKQTAWRAYDLYGRRGHFQQTLFGGPRPTTPTSDVAWDPLDLEMMLEVFDRHFLPQGPTPLPHDPEPEPRPDASWIDPAARGIDDWAVEMSQRPTTWSWRDGVISCKPGPDEYGWLRAPIVADDFVLTVEWKVPRRGNSGIFVRARPVEWTLPPSPSNKERVATLGLTWPSRTGLELQSADDGGPDKYSTGSLYRHAAPASKPSKPAGQWNRTTVRCRGPRVEVWLNGEQVQDTRLDRLPTLKTPPLRGYFGLQNHGDSAEFRNVRHLRLEPPTRPDP